MMMDERRFVRGGMRATPGYIYIYICASRRRTVIIVTRSRDTARRKRWNFRWPSGAVWRRREGGGFSKENCFEEDFIAFRGKRKRTMKSFRGGTSSGWKLII